MDAAAGKRTGEEEADKVDHRCLALREWTGATVVVVAAGTVVGVSVSVTAVAEMVAAVAVEEAVVVDGPFHRPWDAAVICVLSKALKACC
jgi:hypothetical protein